ncbi:MAG: four helix bundle protein [Chitinophaga sp.]|uniref:four helix bundle protein n=1 Tax=Chitinophaga sp. TaxID=1869181 RepID=UPI001B2B5486|nr:four helix bundle protein [Chitinophaga sp.]MBO9733040.1 four helix bundle protein [Chitinophaga sp.]
MRDYKKLEVWRKAHMMTTFVYRDVVTQLPKHEMFALVSQMKRAAYSVPLNIVEGCGRATERDFARFLDHALGSVHEVEYCALLAFDLKFLDESIYIDLNKKINEVKAMLIAFIKTLRIS